MMCLFEPVTDYDFVKGIFIREVQKGSHGKHRWWYCESEDLLLPDFKLSKLGPVVELCPDEAMEILWARGKDEWDKITKTYYTVVPEMEEWLAKRGPRYEIGVL